jgi:predicted DNA-binding protein
MIKEKRLEIRIPTDLNDRLEQVAKQIGKTKAQLCRDALYSIVLEQEKHILITLDYLINIGFKVFKRGDGSLSLRLLKRSPFGTEIIFQFTMNLENEFHIVQGFIDKEVKTITELHKWMQLLGIDLNYSRLKVKR